MPPHCDTLDGPVVKAARKALETGNLDEVLPYVHKEGEAEIRDAFKRVMLARKGDASAREVADLYFFETVVRVHRAGEGAPYTGLKPAGLSEGPVIPIAEHAIESGKVDPLIDAISAEVRKEIVHKFEHLMHLKQHAGEDVAAARAYVEAMLGLEVYSHQIYQALHSEPHAAHPHHA
jgi:hypothetical protein